MAQSSEQALTMKKLLEVEIMKKATDPVCNVCGETHRELFHYNGRKDSHGNKIPRAKCRRCDWRSRWIAAIKKGNRRNIAEKLKAYMSASQHRVKLYEALAMKK